MDICLLALPDLPPEKTAESPGMGLMWLVLPILLVMMLLMPLLSKKERSRTKRLQTLKKHDRVVTSGGLFGTVISFDDQTATLEVTKGVRLTFKRSSIYDIDKQGEGPPQEAPAPAKG
jgi:preprotein translocase subunit YajC